MLTKVHDAIYGITMRHNELTDHLYAEAPQNLLQEYFEYGNDASKIMTDFMQASISHCVNSSRPEGRYMHQCEATHAIIGSEKKPTICSVLST